MPIEIPTKKEWEENQEDGEFAPLKRGEYLAKITKVEEDEQEAYNDPSTLEKVLNVRFEVEETRDGEQPTDEEGEDAEGKYVFFTANLESLGFQQDGTPSKARQFLCHSTNSDIENDKLVIQDEEKLIGRKVYIDVVTKQSKSGNRYNKVSRIKPYKDNPDFESESSEDIPVVEEDDIDTDDIPY
ncbi:MAG: hypothetical protein ACOC5T_07505 [Elusimicrobiota bacterium]